MKKILSCITLLSLCSCGQIKDKYFNRIPHEEKKAPEKTEKVIEEQKPVEVKGPITEVPKEDLLPCEVNQNVDESDDGDTVNS